MKRHLRKHRHHYTAALLMLMVTGLAYASFAAVAFWLGLFPRIAYAATVTLSCDGFKQVASGNDTYTFYSTVRNNGSQTYYPNNNRINNTYFDTHLSVDGGPEYQYGTSEYSLSGPNGSVPPSGTATDKTTEPVPLSAGHTHSLRWRWEDVNFSTIVTCTSYFTTPAPQPKPAPTPQPSPKPKSAPAPNHQPASAPAPIQGSSSYYQPQGSSATGSQPSEISKPTAKPQPPAKPGNFVAQPGDGSSAKLSWDSVIGASSYTLERSGDDKSWQNLKDRISQPFYYDSSTSFDTILYYRLTAVSSSDLKSKPVVAKVKTNAFQHNAGANETLTLTSFDGVLAVMIPGSALDGPANCRFAANPETGLYAIENYRPAAGPYQIICQYPDGVVATAFKQPLAVEIKPKAIQGVDKYASFALAGFSSESQSWQRLNNFSQSDASSVNFRLTSADMAMQIFGQPKKTPLVVLLLLFTGILVAIAAAVFVFLKFLISHQETSRAKETQQDYRHKERGY